MLLELPGSIDAGSRSTSNAGFIRSVFDLRSDCFGHAPIKNGRNDVIGMQLVRTDDLCDRICCGELHRFIYPGSATVECPTKNSGEAQDVVDLVWIIGSSGG